MRVIAFNVKRWGASTSLARRDAFKKRFADMKPNLTLYTELTAACPDPQPFNPTYRRKNPSQLCYGGKYLAAAGEQDVTFRRLESDEVQRTPAYLDVYPSGPPLNGLVDRAPAMVTSDTGGIPVVLFHAPASKGATRVIVLVACWLESKYAEYVFLGDLNTTPAAIKKQVRGTRAAFIANRIRYTSSGTYRGTRSKASKRYDFVIAKRKGDAAVTIEPMLSGLSFTSSDHAPIIVDVSG